MSTKNQDSFTKNYAILENAVEKLQDDENISVDDLLPLVDQATEAYGKCKKRLQLVEDALEQRFQNNATNEKSNDE